MFSKIFNRKPKNQNPITESEAVYAAGAQDEIATAIKSLLIIVERGTCDPKLPKKILELAEHLQSEAQTNHDLIVAFIKQNEAA